MSPAVPIHANGLASALRWPILTAFQPRLSACGRLLRNAIECCPIVEMGNLPEFVATVGLLIGLPGPSVLFIVSRGVALGRRAALATVVGNSAGLSVQVTVVALGLGAILASSLILFTLVKVAGAAYLIFLGAQMVRHRKVLAILADATELPRGALRGLREGFVVGATNPNGLVIFTAVLPQFVDPARSHLQLQLALLGAICVAIALASDSAWAIASGTVRSWVRRSPHTLEYIAGVGDVVRIGLGARLALSARKH